MLNLAYNMKIDDKAIKRAVDKAAPETLSQAGRYVMGIVRASLHQRRDPNKSSVPGKQPFSHASAFNRGFKRTVVYALEEDRRAVLVGPQLVRVGMSEIAKSHEFGGSRSVKHTWHEELKSKDIKPGVVAPVTSKYVSRRRDPIVYADPDSDPQTGRPIFWIRLRTKSQVEHSVRLVRRMRLAHTVTRRDNYPPRPFMRPGLAYATPKLSSFWRNAVKP